MRGIAQYQKSRIEAASQQQIMIMLVRTAYRKLIEAEDLLDQPAELTQCLHHVRAILLELNHALDHDLAPELCAKLSRLYVWGVKETIAIPTEPERLDALQKVVASLLEGWEAAVSGG